MTLDAVGGVWRYALDLAQGLQGRGIETVFATFGPAASTEQVAEANAVGRLVETGAPLDWTAATEDELGGTAALISRLVDDHGLDLVHLNLPSQAAGLQLPIPIVAVSHSCVVTWFKAVRGSAVPPDWAWQEKLNREGFARVDVLLAPSRSHAHLLRAAYGEIGPIEIVPNTAQWSEGQPKEAFVLAAGRWWDEGKNGALLDRAAPQTNWPIRMAGSQNGPSGQWQPLEHAEVLGSLPNAELRDLMSRAAIVVSPSIYEPFGLVALEAALAGAALVLADIPTYRELWDGAAVFVPTDDAEALALTLNALAEDANRRAVLGAAACERAGQFTMARQVEAMLVAYGLAAERHRSRFPHDVRLAG
jgi:glycosyltransferase involved in cell wall biosynthesis